MTDSKPEQSDNETISLNQSIPIDADKFSAVFLGLSDTWVIGWIGFGLLVSLFPLFSALEQSASAPPGAGLRIAAFVGAYWLLTSPLGFPRWLNGYRMARRGLIVPGFIQDISVIGAGTKRAHRINVLYAYNGKAYKAIANPMNRNPEPGSYVLVAIRPDKPHKSRIVPYDFRLDKTSRQEFMQKLGIKNP